MSDESFDGSEIEEWDADANEAWCEKWAPGCPVRNHQRSATLVGYRERELGRLQLRAVVRVGTEGECAVIAEEDEETVHVRVLLCWPDSADRWNDREYCNCGVHVYLDNPLNGRKVIWVDGEVELPLFVPHW